MCLVQVMELAPHVGPACDLGDATGLIQPIEPGERIRLQPASERGQVIGGMLRLAIWRVSKPHGRRFAAARWPIVTNISPQTSGLGFPVSRSQYRNRYVVRVDFRRIQYVFSNCVHQWLQ